MKKLPPQSREQFKALAELYQTTNDVRLRTRMQMMLLAVEKGLSAPDIAAIDLPFLIWRFGSHDDYKRATLD